MTSKPPVTSARTPVRIATSACAAIALAAFAAATPSPAGPSASSPVAAAPAARFAFSDERGDAVVVVDAGAWKVERKIDVGKRPRGIAVTPDGTRLLVALSGSPVGGPGVDESTLPPPDRRADGIGVVDLATGRVERVLASGNDPETFTLSPDGRTLYATNEDGATVSFVDLASGRVAGSVKVGDEPEGIDASRDGRRLFVACEAADAVYVIDVAKRRVEKTIAFTGRPRTIRASKDGRRVYVAVEFAGKLAVIDAATLAVERTIDLADASGLSRPMGLAERPDGTVAVALGRSGAIAIVDPVTGEVPRRIGNVGARPWGLALSADGAYAYTANGSSGDVSEVSLDTGRVTRKLKIGTSPWGVVRLPRPQR